MEDTLDGGTAAAKCGDILLGTALFAARGLQTAGLVKFYRLPAPLSIDPAVTRRVDKWLHYVRVFKTRSLATQACDRNHVKIDHQALKPSRELRVGEVLNIERGDLKLTVKVIDFPAARIGPPLVPQFYENLTPPENYIRASEARQERAMVTPRPHDLLTRPTKKDLRDIRKLMGRE